MENKTLAKIGMVAVVAVIIGLAIYNKYVKDSVEGTTSVL